MDEFIEEVIKYYKFPKELKFLVKKGYYSECCPIYSKDGKGILMYSDGSYYSLFETERKNGEIIGFFIKLSERKHIFHELEHAKRYLEGKSQNEILVEIFSVFTRIKFFFSKWACPKIRG